MMFLPRSVCWRSILFAVVLILGAFSSLRANDLPPPTQIGNPGEQRWNLISECQMIVLPQKVAWAMVPDLSDDEKIEAAWAKIQQMIDRGEATLVANLSVRSEPGARAVAESIEELRYAVEFTPPILPDSLPKDLKASVALKSWPLVGITPTAFETRNIGATMELEATASNDGQWVSVAVVPQHVRFLRFTKTDAGVLASGEHLNVEQPYFSTMKSTISMHLRSGQRVMLGMHKVPDDDNKVELFFFRVRTQQTGKAK
jgi:hypothetical protein